MSTSTEGKTTSAGAPQDDSRRTTVFVVVAVACLAITALVEWTSRPEAIQEFGKVGQEFYPEFTDPTVATSLSVKVVDSEDLKPLEFSVKQASNGRWVIPSHHNYPADAADQLAETASSVIGIKRGAMVTRWPADHPRYGVVDPETESVSVDEIDGIGKRLTFRGKDDEVLASYIIGKKVDDQENRFYVRHPGEDETYIAELDIELSTKFSDWVKTDLLDINAADVRTVEVHDYSFEERGMSLAVTNTIETKLSRESSTEDWKMEGLDEATMQVNDEAMRETVNTIADLAIAGVRPKQPGLTGDLDLDRTVVASQRDVDRIQSDLLSRGFLLQPSKEDPEKLRLIAREGEMVVGTADGLAYQLHFGRAFTGSDEELEIGISSSGDADGTDKKDDSKAATDETASDETANNESETELNAAANGTDQPDDAATPSGKPGRYVFVRVQVDPSLLGEKPNPVEPEKSPELIEAEKKAAEPQADETSEPENEAGDAASTDSDADQPATEQPTGDEAGTEQEDPAVVLKALQDAFADQQRKYNEDKQALAEFEQRLKAAEEKAVELNRRFAQWYYVIPGDQYDSLTLSQEDLIEAKEGEEGEPVGEPMPELQLNLPSADNPGLSIPTTNPLVEPEPSETEPSPESDATEPDTTESDTTEPDTTEPDATEPDTTEPDATESNEPETP